MSLADELLADLEEAGLEVDAPIEEITNNDDIDDIDIDVDMDTGWDDIDPSSIQSVARYIQLLLN